MSRLMTIAICSCGYVVYDAEEMNYHGMNNPVHYWVYVPDIILSTEIKDEKDRRLHRRIKRLRNR